MGGAKTKKHSSDSTKVADDSQPDTLYEYAMVSFFAATLFGFLYTGNRFAEAQMLFMWIESYRFFNGGVSFLDFAGSLMVCYGFRDATEKLLGQNDERTKSLHSSLLSHYVVTITTCTFLQFGGTTTTGLFLGQNPSWAAGTHVWSALLLAWWLVFCCPFDFWYRAFSSRWVQAPVKIFATISSAHAVTSWGVDKALLAEHQRMRSSVWAALACGYFSSCFGWVVVGWFETGGERIRKSGPTWAMQRSVYMVIFYYFTTDPHGALAPVRRVLGGLVGAVGVWPVAALGQAIAGDPLSREASKTIVCGMMLVLQFSMDVLHLDLLPPLNALLAAAVSAAAPPQMLRAFTQPSSSAAAASDEGDGEHFADGGRRPPVAAATPPATSPSSPPATRTPSARRRRPSAGRAAAATPPAATPPAGATRSRRR